VFIHMKNINDITGEIKQWSSDIINYQFILNDNQLQIHKTYDMLSTNMYSLAVEKLTKPRRSQVVK
jgi:hypothetical protein